MGIGARIKLRRNELGLSLRDLSNQMGYKNHSTIARIEEETIDIPHSRIVQFASVLGVEVEYLMGLDTSSSSPLMTEKAPQSNVLGQKIKYARLEKGLTQEELGQLLGVEKSAIAKYENGRIINLKHATLVRISEVLDISLSDLFVEDDEENSDAGQQSINDNRSIFARNLQVYMAKSGKSRREVSQALDVSYNTFADWYKGKTYPRIDKIQALADYFGISKADLVEEVGAAGKFAAKEDETENKAKKEILDVIIRLHTDSEFLAVVEMISKLDGEKIATIQRFLNAFTT